MESNFCAPYSSNNSYIPRNYQQGEFSQIKRSNDLASLIRDAKVITLNKDNLPSLPELEETVKDNIKRFGYTIRITNSEGFGNITGAIMLLNRLIDLSDNLKIMLIFDDEIDPDTQLTAEGKFDRLCSDDKRIQSVRVNKFDNKELPVIGLTGMGDVDFTDTDKAKLTAPTLALMSNCNTYLHLQPYGYKHSSRAIYTSALDHTLEIAKFGDTLKATGYNLPYVKPSLGNLIDSISECTKLENDEPKNLQEILEAIYKNTKDKAVVNVVVVYGIDQYSHAASAVVDTITGSLKNHPDTFAFVIYSGSEKLNSCIPLQEFNVMNHDAVAVQCKGTNKKIFDFLVSQAKFAAFEGAGTFATVLATGTPFVLFSQSDTIPERFVFAEANPTMTISNYEKNYEATTISISKYFKATAVQMLLLELHAKLPNNSMFSTLKEELHECALFLEKGDNSEKAREDLKKLIKSIQTEITDVEVAVEILWSNESASNKELKPIMYSLNILKAVTPSDIDVIFDNSAKESLIKFAQDAHDQNSSVNEYMRTVSECIKEQADQVVIGLYHIFTKGKISLVNF